MVTLKLLPEEVVVVTEALEILRTYSSQDERGREAQEARDLRIQNIITRLEHEMDTTP